MGDFVKPAGIAPIELHGDSGGLVGLHLRYGATQLDDDGRPVRVEGVPVIDGDGNPVYEDGRQKASEPVALVVAPLDSSAEVRIVAADGAESVVSLVADEETVVDVSGSRTPVRVESEAWPVYVTPLLADDGGDER
jgi:hypothetical protein